MSACRSLSHSATLWHRGSNALTLTALSNVTFDRPSSLQDLFGYPMLLCLGKKESIQLQNSTYNQIA
jgi:hypothetical protein